MPDLTASPSEMAHRLVAVALMMKRQYQDAGLRVAREFCAEYGIDAIQIEHDLRATGRPFGRSGAQVDGTHGGTAWFWTNRKVGKL